MEDRKKLLEKLVTTCHLNVPERRLLGDAPTFSELLNVTELYFEAGVFLPSVIKEWDDSRLCYEGYSLEKQGGSYILHLQVAGPVLNLYANQKTKYDNLKDALHALLTKGFRFNIDGIQILDR